MKKLSFMLAFVALFATASFAGTSTIGLNKVNSFSKIEKKIKSNYFKKYTCTVTTSYVNANGNTVTTTATVTSTISQLSACIDAAAATMVNIP